MDLENDHVGLSWIFRDSEERRLRRPPSSERDDTGSDDAFVLPNIMLCCLLKAMLSEKIYHIIKSGEMERLQLYHSLFYSFCGVIHHSPFTIRHFSLSTHCLLFGDVLLFNFTFLDLSALALNPMTLS